MKSNLRINFEDKNEYIIIEAEKKSEAWFFSKLLINHNCFSFIRDNKNFKDENGEFLINKIIINL